MTLRLRSQDDEDDSSDESGGLSLKDYFSVGQLVTCRINSLEKRRAKGGNLKDSKRIGLSLRLSYLHEGLTLDVLHEGLVIITFLSFPCLHVLSEDLIACS